MSQYIGIRGQVEIVQRNENTRKLLTRTSFHNTITSALASGIATYLAGQVTNTSSTPQYVGIGAGESSESDFDMTRLVDEYSPDEGGSPYRFIISNKSVNLPSSNSSNSSYASVTFRSFISSGELGAGYEISELGLYNTALGADLLSRVELPADQRVIKVAGSGIDILWNIIIEPSAGDSVESI